MGILPFWVVLPLVVHGLSNWGMLIEIFRHTNQHWHIGHTKIVLQTSTETPTIQRHCGGTEKHCTCCHTNRSWQMDAQMRGRHLIRNASPVTSPHHTGRLWLSAGLRRPCPTSVTCLPLCTLVNHPPPLSMYIAHYPIPPPPFPLSHLFSLSQASWRVHCVTWNLSPPLFAPWKMCQLEFHADGGQKKGLNILKVYFTA